MEQTKLIAERLKWARVNADVSVEEMAKAVDVETGVYEKFEEGSTDFSFTFLFKCAEKLGMDISELVSGLDPKLSFYNITRAGKGMPIKRREGFDYRHIAPFLKDRLAEPFIVTAKFDPEAKSKPIQLSTHKGQELDYVLKGSLLVQLEDHTEVLREGDSIYYDSSHPHGMIAEGDEDCVFMAVVFKVSADESSKIQQAEATKKIDQSRYDNLIYKKYTEETLDEKGRLKEINFNLPENFNFAYDIVDVLSEKSPDKCAFLWLSANKDVKNFSFKDVAELSNQAANYFASLGIKKGDRVMLVLKRHWQFWVSIIALHKLGAVALPATALLVQKDYEYRFNAAKVSAVVCTGDDDCTQQIDLAEPACETLKLKISTGGKREGWHDFDSEFLNFPKTMNRVETLKDDPQIMFFTSGTTGYPKIATHSATYPMAHLITARWWHNVNPDGLHFTISDTGWGKALWGKLYGQWLCEAPVFVYDFVKFNADDILPLFKEHNITTFCAPPTMYRFFIKEDLAKYDLSSLEYVTTAGEALNPEVYHRFQEATGLKIMEGFGQTETTLTIANLYGMEPKPGAMGLPSPQYDMMLMKEDGTEAGVGEVGEIVVKTDKRTDGVFMGYYLDEDKTKEVWYDGVYHTGDTAWRDEDGYIWYVGRVDDLIKSSGYRIGPFEIESVIMELPYVLECAITGVPDEIRGQIVKATVVLTKGTEKTEELKKDLQEYVKKHTAPYKYPRIVDFVDELPKTISGKIKRNEIKKMSENK